MSDLIRKAETDEDWRREAFPACRDRVFMAHAAVTAIPQVAVDAMDDFNRKSGTGELDYSHVLLEEMDEVRDSAARIIGCDSDEIALLGPTSLGLSLVANGLDWNPGDEIVTYLDDYPANVYPWKNLEKKGVKVVYLEPDEMGRITPELVRNAITPNTKLLALASCHFLTGWLLDIEAIGEIAREHRVLFCLDAIQTVGAFPTWAKHVDFLSADSHKWMLGPMTAGIFYVQRGRFDLLRPSLLGAWNVKSPNFIPQDKVEFEPGGRRYEPGVLNAQGLLGMKASVDMLTGIGISNVALRLIDLKVALGTGLEKLGFEVVGPKKLTQSTGITTFTHRDSPERIGKLFAELNEAGIVTSYRHDRGGLPYIRFSPHFYNTHAEVERVLKTLADAQA